MDTRRIILYSVLFYLGYTLWNTWQIDNGIKETATQQQAVHEIQSPLLPEVADTKGQKTTLMPEVGTSEMNEIKNQHFIQVKTDVLNLAIDPNQGDVISAALLEYPESLQEKNLPFMLLQNNASERYIANSNLIIVNSQNQVQNLHLNYTSQSDNYILDNHQKELKVILEGTTDTGLSVKKIFTFTRGSYLVNVDYVLQNAGDQTWKGYFNTQLLRTSPPEDKSSVFHIGSFTGASYSNPEVTRYKKISYSDIAKSNLNQDVQGGWIAMQQHYFLSAWVPASGSKNKFYTRYADNDYTIGAVSQPIEIKPGQEQQIGARLYVGPEITDVLKSIAPGLDLTVDYGLLWFLSSLLFSLMKAIYGVVGNWGWSIILVTVLIKLAFYRLSATSYKSMAGMRKIQPKLQAIKERFGDNKAEMTKATMELYKQEKINPLGGCLPIVIQIPVFIALYWVLLESVELRQAPFILWIQDLASADPYHVLPIIMGATMLIQQKLNPAPPDPMQAKMMMFLPILFTGLFWSFPAGLVLYWIVNNTLSILQQWYITYKYSQDDSKPSKKLATAK